MKRSIGKSIGLAMFGALALFPAMAQDAAEKAPRVAETAAATAAPVQPWVLNCSNQGAADTLRCTMSQTIVANETGQRVISAVIFRDADSNALQMTLGLPHGLDLPAGIEVWVDEQPRIQNEIKTADQNGSYSTLPLQPNVLEGMKAGTTMNVAVTAASGQEIIMQFSLVGFTSAVDRV